MSEPSFSHLDSDGRLRMVDISDKEPSRRVAQASCVVKTKEVPRGGLSSVQYARLAGIQAAKRTADLIPLCHPLALAQVQVEIGSNGWGYEVRAEVVTTGRTGVEMEALTACLFAALTLIDSLLEDDPTIRVENLTLLRKSGGKSGDWGRDVASNASTETFTE